VHEAHGALADVLGVERAREELVVRAMDGVAALERRHVAAQRLQCERAKFVTGFSRWVKGQAQGLQPGGFKLWVNCIQLWVNRI
jgi:hypothetical protein